MLTHRWRLNTAAMSGCRYNSGRGSPEYVPMSGRGRSRSPGSHHERPQAEFITTFGSGGDGNVPAVAAGGEYGGGASSGARRQQQGQQQGQAVKDALPGVADPALEGPAMLPAAAYKLHGVRPDDSQRRDRYGGSVSGRVSPACVFSAVSLCLTSLPVAMLHGHPL